MHNPVVCDDPDLCTLSNCDPGTGNCVDVPVDCDDADECTTDSCDPATGCFHESIECDDGDLCTINGCDTATGCEFQPVDCSDLNDLCNVGVCNPGSGLCVSEPIVDCSDGDLCTQDICDPADGTCSNPPEDCDDGIECTNDSCDDPATGCINVPDDFNCDDDLVCTDDTCDPIEGCHYEDTCNDDNPCTDDICDPVEYCVFNAVVDGTSCDDGAFCNGVDTCIGGECQSGIACTDDLLFCNGIETCDEVNDECIRTGDPCLPEGQCDEGNDMCWSCELTISPSSLTVPTFGTRQFSASSNGNCPIPEPDPSCYTWEVAIQESTGSNISSIGSYTAGGYEGIDIIQVSDTCNLNISANATAIVIPDTDEDGIRNEDDNCPEHPNGIYLGTCIRITGGFFTGFGVPCIDSTDCASDEICDTAQLDFDETGVGDACECRGNFDGDSDIDGNDAYIFKVGFGRGTFFNPCPSNQ